MANEKRDQQQSNAQQSGKQAGRAADARQGDVGPTSGVPKPESSSEYEGAGDRKRTGNPPTEVKTETSSSSGE